jgi:hypothetical protein
MTWRGLEIDVVVVVKNICICLTVVKVLELPRHAELGVFIRVKIKV